MSTKPNREELIDQARRALDSWYETPGEYPLRNMASLLVSLAREAGWIAVSSDEVPSYPLRHANPPQFGLKRNPDGTIVVPNEELTTSQLTPPSAEIARLPQQTGETE